MIPLAVAAAADVAAAAGSRAFWLAAREFGERIIHLPD
jgi:hypothetical protein